MLFWSSSCYAAKDTEQELYLKDKFHNLMIEAMEKKSATFEIEVM